MINYLAIGFFDAVVKIGSYDTGILIRLVLSFAAAAIGLLIAVHQIDKNKHVR